MLVPVFRVVAIAAVIGALVMVARKGAPPEPERQPTSAERRAETPDGAPAAPPPLRPSLNAEPGPASPPAAEAPAPPSSSDERKPGTLPNERAETERQAKLDAPVAETPPEPPKPKRLYQVRVEDAGTLKSGELTIRLGGIEPRSALDRCKFDSGKEWPCGAVARAALTRLIRGRSVECVLEEKSGEQEVVTRCTAGNTDLSQWMVRQGWAEPATADDKLLADAEENARRENRGVWQKSAPEGMSLQ